MKWIAGVFMGLCVLAFCSSGGSQIDRITEDGTEVVLNHVRPYKVPNEPSALRLEREFVIDAEDPAIASAGLADIFRFGVGNDGAIYIAQRPRKDVPVVFKFDKAGRLQRSFGRTGQGPGEIDRCAYFGVIGHDEIYVLDAQGKRITTFDATGGLLRETRLPPTLLGAIPIANGDFLAPRGEVLPDEDQEETAFDLLDRNFVLIKMMHRFRFPIRRMGAAKINAYLTNPTGSFATDRIYLGLPGRDYEILVFDLAGNLLRKIRKEYMPVAVTAGFRKAALARLPQGSPVAGRLEFPDNKPSFQYMFADEKGRLFVATSEVDKVSGQDICDIFSPSGLFIGRAAVGYFDLLRLYWEGLNLDVVAKNQRFYVLHEKQNGFKELVVSKAIWN
jgi:hypothetical protein